MSVGGETGLERQEETTYTGSGSVELRVAVVRVVVVVVGAGIIVVVAVRVGGFGGDDLVHAVLAVLHARQHHGLPIFMCVWE